MGWANCGTDSKGRPIGYANVACCDAPGCEAIIDRGLDYACGGMHGAEDRLGGPACDGYFCSPHRAVCFDGIARCLACRDVFDAAHPCDEGSAP